MSSDKFDSIIFDVDGTLWDVRAVVSDAWRDTIKKETDWPITFDAESIGAMFGKTMDTIFFHFYPNATMEEYEHLTSIIYGVQNEYLVKHAPKLYEGVAETLALLSKKYRLYIVTNAQKGYVETLFEVHDIGKYFEDWLCYGDTSAPKHVTISRLIERNGLKNPVYVGDTQGDADSCAIAGIPIIQAEYGLGKIENPYGKIKCFSGLKPLLMGINTVIFDLDGTLLDTLEDLKNSVNFALSQNVMPERTLSEIRSFVGNGVEMLIRRSVCAGTDEASILEILSEFRRHYEANNRVLTKPYDGVIEMLHNLKKMGYKLAVVSNKLESATKELCDYYFPGIMDAVVGDNPKMAKKPETDMVDAALSRLNSNSESAVYVGDSDVDIATAANAGMSLIMVEWGFRNRSDMEKLGAKCFINKADDIFSAIDGYCE